MTVIQIPDEQAAALKARAAAQGLTLENFLANLAGESADSGQLQRAQAAAARIREIQKRSKPDPEGWTVLALPSQIFGYFVHATRIPLVFDSL